MRRDDVAAMIRKECTRRALVRVRKRVPRAVLAFSKVLQVKRMQRQMVDQAGAQVAHAGILRTGVPSSERFLPGVQHPDAVAWDASLRR